MMRNSIPPMDSNSYYLNRYLDKCASEADYIEMLEERISKQDCYLCGKLAFDGGDAYVMDGEFYCADCIRKVSIDEIIDETNEGKWSRFVED